MKSYKTISITFLILVLLIGTVSIFANGFIRNEFAVMEDTELKLQEVSKVLSENDLPIKVLKNISSQVIENQRERDSLGNAYQTNREKLITNLEKAKLLMTELEVDFREETANHKKQLLQNQIEEFQQKFLQVFLEALTQDKEVLTQLEETDDQMLENAEELYLLHHEKLLYTRKVYMTLLNLFMMMGIGMSLFGGFIVYRIGYKYFQFISHTYLKMENHDYSLTKQWRGTPFFKEEKEMLERIQKIFEEQKLSQDFKELITHKYHIDDIMDALLFKVNALFGVKRVGIAFIDYKRKTIMAEYGTAVYDKVLINTGFEVPLESSSLYQLTKSKEAILNNDLESSLREKPHSTSLLLATKEGIRSNMVIPLISNGEVFGFVFFSAMEKNFFTEDHLRIGTKLIYEITGFLNRAFFTKVVLTKTTTAFAQLVDKKDNETGDHIFRMVKYSTIIAEGVRAKRLDTHLVDKRLILEIERNAAVHDIGKVAIPDAILKKPGKLEAEEWEIMKTHAQVGGEIFGDLRKEFAVFDENFFEVAEQIAAYHHERFDGTGYPKGLKGQEIPLVARIVTVGDVFDALTSERVYKRSFSFEEALSILEEGKGTHFDPVVIDAFFDKIEEIKKIYQMNR